MTEYVHSMPAATPAKAQPVLVLQGGGALGSYQAGAYQALCHFDFEPEWIAGISIGAINAAIIAGNDNSKRIDRTVFIHDQAHCVSLFSLQFLYDAGRQSRIWASTLSNF